MSLGKGPSALCAARVGTDRAACSFASSIQPCLCPYYGLYDNLLLSALQQPLLHHALHLLFGPCSLPLRGLHLPHCSLDNWSYGTPHGSKFLHLGNVDWAAVPRGRSTVTKQEEKLKLRALCRSAVSPNFTAKLPRKLS